MPTVIVPAGMMLGEYHRPGDDAGPEHWHVNVGGYAEYLDRDEKVVWVAAMLDTAKHARLESTRSALRKAVQAIDKDPIVAPDPVIEALLGRRLLAEFDPINGDIQVFAQSHRLLPTANGLGNTRDQPFDYRIAVAGKTRLTVNGDIYALWANTVYYPSIWESCNQLAKDIKGYTPPSSDGQDEPIELDVSTLARALAANVPLLISTEAAILDPIVD